MPFGQENLCAFQLGINLEDAIGRAQLVRSCAYVYVHVRTFLVRLGALVSPDVREKFV